MTANVPLASAGSPAGSPDRAAGASLRAQERFRRVLAASPDGVLIIRERDGQCTEINARFTTLTGLAPEEVVGRHWRTVRLLDGPGERSALEDLLGAEDAVVDRPASYLDRQGEARTCALSAMVMTVDGEAHRLVILRDPEALERAEAALRRSEARFRDLFQTMASGVWFFQVTASGDRILCLDLNQAAEGLEGRPRELCLNRPLAEVLAFRGAARRLEKALLRAWRGGAPETVQIQRRRTGHLVSCREYRVERLSSGELIAVCHDLTARQQAEERLLAQKERLQTMTSELVLVQERERRRLAQDLHDQIGQNLSVIRMRLHKVRESVADEETARELAEIWTLLQEAIGETRTLTFELSPPILHELGLPAALDWLGETFARRHGIPCSVEDDRLPKPLGDDLAIVLFRAVRELLINVVKHAQARRIQVQCLRAGGEIRIVVTDDGIGFAPDRPQARGGASSGFGLFSIRERLSHLGGRLQVRSAPGQGTRVTLFAPLT
ncbi:MAG: ATP-binding protein [Thermodesulfobacteriota bacterium]